MKYQLRYFDATIIDNHDVLSNEQVITEIKNRYHIVPNNVEISQFDGPWVKYSAAFTISEPLIPSVEHVLKYVGRTIEVFSVYDEDGNVVITEDVNRTLS